MMLTQNAFCAPSLACAFAAAIANPQSAEIAPPPRAPIEFVENLGQWPVEVVLQARAGGVIAWLGSDGISLSLVGATRLEPLGIGATNGTSEPAGIEAEHVRLRFATGAVVGEPVGVDALRGRHNYLFGRESTAWHIGARSYARTCYRSLWPGVDVELRATAGGDGLAYDVHLEAGAELEAVQFEVEGGDRMFVRDDGALVVTTRLGELVQSPPFAWQIGPNGDRRPRRVAFRSSGERRFGFYVDGHDPSLPLVIDPDLRWATYLGGDGGELGTGVGFASNGDVMVGGYTTSVAFPGASRVDFDAFAARVSGGTPVWTTFFGGSEDDIVADLEVGPADKPVLTGWTRSTNGSLQPFPITPNAQQPTFGGGFADAWFAQLTLDGLAFVTSTYLGGGQNDFACDIDVDAAANVTVGGYTESVNFPTMNRTQGYHGNRDAFVTRYTGATISYSTFLGGATIEGFFNPSISPPNSFELGLDVDEAGRILVTGSSSPPASPQLPPFPTTTGAAPIGGKDAFVAILDPAAASQLAWGTLVGGGRGEAANEAAFGPGGSVVIAGGTRSGDPMFPPAFPTTAGAFSQNFVGPVDFNDAFVTWFTPSSPGSTSGFTLQYSTLIGGLGFDAAFALDVDACGHATIGGFCASGFPSTAGSLRPNYLGPQEGFLARVRPDGRGPLDLTYSTFLDARGVTLGVALDGHGGAAFCGGGRVGALPTSPGAFQPGVIGTRGAYVGHLELLPEWTPGVGVSRDRSGSAPHCEGEISIAVDRLPVGNAAFEILISNAPRNAIGALFVGGPQPVCVPAFGAILCLAPFVTVPATSNALGCTTQSLNWSINLPQTGTTFRVQSIWVNAPGCGGLLSSSAVLGL